MMWQVTEEESHSKRDWSDVDGETQIDDARDICIIFVYLFNKEDNKCEGQ